MECLGSAYCGKVAVALVCEDQTVWPAALNACGHRWSTSMRGFLPVYVYVSVGKHGTANGAHAHGLVGHAHFFYYLCHQLVHHAMRAPCAVVHGCVVHEFWLGVDKVLGRYNVILHSCAICSVLLLFRLGLYHN